MEDLGVYDNIRTLRFERRLPVGADALWPYLAEPEAMAVWRSRCEFEPRVGGAAVIAGTVDGKPVHGSVTAWSPGERLAFSVPGLTDATEDRHEISYALAKDGEGTALTLTHGLPRGWMGGWTGGEWHAGLDALALALSGADAEALAVARKPTEALVAAYNNAFFDARAKQPGEHMRDFFAVTPFHATLGLELVEISRDRLVGRLASKSGLTLPGGHRMHGGAAAAAIDAVAAYHAAMTAEARVTETGQGERGRGFNTATTGLTVDYLRPLRAESYSVTTSLLHASGHLIRIRAEMADDDGPVAAATATFTC
jgi:acyl-coenzyme A thioesterase PaaI-like protein/uncharacterized protein YndB with AHSA1/START domain